jgi:hypothetical protein
MHTYIVPHQQNTAGILDKNMWVDLGALKFLRKMHFLLEVHETDAKEAVMSKMKFGTGELAVKIVRKVSFWFVFVSETAHCTRNMYKIWVPLSCVTA